jgi:hypothetical protein
MPHNAKYYMALGQEEALPFSKQVGGKLHEAASIECIGRNIKDIWFYPEGKGATTIGPQCRVT